MGKYVHKFNTAEDFNAIYNGSGYTEPWVSYTEGRGVDYNKVIAVDLGLPSGTMWAAMNVGASSPEDYGDFFAWGETEPKESYDSNWSNYDYGTGARALTKYNNDESRGTVDHLYSLEGSDDAATVNMGSPWHMPSVMQAEELAENTTPSWETLNGVNGCRFTSKTNGNSIFIPASGEKNGTSHNSSGSWALLWTSDVYTDIDWMGTSTAYDMEFNSSGTINVDNNYRTGGKTVRGVVGNILLL